MAESPPYHSEGGRGMGGSLPLNSESLLEMDEENAVLSRVGRWDSAHMGCGMREAEASPRTFLGKFKSG